MRGRRDVLLILLIVLGLCAAGVACSFYFDARDSAQRAQADVATVRRLVSQIDKMRAMPAAASEARPQQPELNRCVKEAATAAGMPDRVTTIDPAAPVQLEDPNYTEMPIRLGIDRVSVQQLVAFLYHLGQQDAKLRPKQIVLTHPSGDAASDVWTIDVTFAYLIYSPHETRMRR